MSRDPVGLSYRQNENALAIANALFISRVLNPRFRRGQPRLHLPKPLLHGLPYCPRTDLPRTKKLWPSGRYLEMCEATSQSISWQEKYRGGDGVDRRPAVAA